jgi:hypothetical protein
MRNKTVHRAVRLEEALADLMQAEYVMEQLKSGDVFQALRIRQRELFLEVLNLLRDLIHDLSQDAVQEKQLAS